MNDLYISDIILNRVDIGDFSAYPFSLPAIKNFDSLRLNSRVTFFVGENGTGKSTLLEAVAVRSGFNPEGGSRNFNFSTMPTHSALYEHIALARGLRKPRDGYFLRAESFYNVATEIERMDREPSFDRPVKVSYGGKSLHEQSHGESFISLVMNRFFGDGLYILDEPEAALSPTRQMTLMVLMRELENLNSQFIIATHSPILMAYPGAEIYVFSEGDIALTPYKETEHYTVTKQFINNPDGMLKHLI
ncbi:MAG: AAA family ATPase [Oscillospiraceae bacterium]|nr:AAA family ATPase [Oscillospiraceae bacterium]